MSSSSRPSTLYVHCEDTLNILAQTLLLLLKEASYPINLLPTAFSFIKSCYLNHRSQEAFCSAHCVFKQQGRHFSFALCCKAVSTALFSPANTAKFCGTKKKKDHCCDRNTGVPELWLYTEMLMQRILEPKEAVQSQFQKPGLQNKTTDKGSDLVERQKN